MIFFQSSVSDMALCAY